MARPAARWATGARCGRRSGAEGTVIDTEKKLGDLNVARRRSDKGTLKLGDAVQLRVDGERRRATRANHSATHLLHARSKTCSVRT